MDALLLLVGVPVYLAIGFTVAVIMIARTWGVLWSDDRTPQSAKSYFVWSMIVGWLPFLIYYIMSVTVTDRVFSLGKMLYLWAIKAELEELEELEKSDG